VHEARRVRYAVLAVSLGGLTVLALHARAIESDLRRPLHVRDADHVGSSACRACHPGNYRSWHRTFHRTMTQEATAASVLGNFGGARFEYMGIEAHMHRDAQGRFVMDFSRRGGLERWRAEVVRTVGSRRYQQYLAREGDVYFRLPIAWNVQEQRFMHMNGAFLTPDPTPESPGGSIARADYDRHVTRWNDNCIYCHNVAANPGLDPATGRFDSRVAELGIACEACHGPGALHVASNQDPLRRLTLHLRELADPTIANPARLGKQRSAEVCGHCHGQRIAPNIERVHREGDLFVPGDRLGAYSRPLARDSVQNGERELFAARFWNDGTARLTAYEYQGLLASACTKRGGLTCIDCHAMHGGDPRGQLRPDRSGNAMCTSCHQPLTDAAALARHSHHAAGSSGTRCVECHMPRIVYGLVGAHRSHHIDSPSAASDQQPGRPGACTLCHVDKSRDWAAAALRRWAGQPPHARTQDAANTAEATHLLLSGDAIERALGADALGRPEADAAHAPLAPRLGLLFDTLEHDDYPAVRAIAWRSLRALLSTHFPASLPAVTAFTPTDDLQARQHSLAAVRAPLPQGASEPPSAADSELRTLQETTRIFIGE
jgi:predicted CXXCH cytochrome family protein